MLITLDPVLTVTPTVLEDIVLSNMIQDDRGIGEFFLILFLLLFVFVCVFCF